MYINDDLQVNETYVKRLKEIGKQIKVLQKEDKEIREGIKLESTNVDTKDFGAIQVQVSHAHIDLEFDLDTFRNENPDLYDKYQKIVYKAEIKKVVLKGEK